MRERRPRWHEPVDALVVGAVVLSTASCGVGEQWRDPVARDRAAEAVTSVASHAASALDDAPRATSLRELPPLVGDASWVERDGTRALVISPTDVLRESGDAATYDEAWRRVVAAVPEADSPGMRDQFVCHATFAAWKKGWYLEPARPDVGYWATVRAGCNPGDVTDVG